MTKIPNSRQNDTVFQLKKKNETTRRLITVHCLLLLPEKTDQVIYFAGTFNASIIHQIW